MHLHARRHAEQRQVRSGFEDIARRAVPSGEQEEVKLTLAISQAAARVSSDAVLRTGRSHGFDRESEVAGEIGAHDARCRADFEILRHRDKLPERPRSPVRRQWLNPERARPGHGFSAIRPLLTSGTAHAGNGVDDQAQP